MAWRDAERGGGTHAVVGPAVAARIGGLVPAVRSRCSCVMGS